MVHSLHALLRDVGLAVPAELADVQLSGITSDSRAVVTDALFLGFPGVQWMAAASGVRRWRPVPPQL